MHVELWSNAKCQVGEPRTWRPPLPFFCVPGVSLTLSL